jgi:hypothetical protein
MGADPALFVSLGPLGLRYILEVGGSGFFRLGAVQPHLESGKLVRIKDAPEFSYPAYAIYAGSGDGELIQTAVAGLRQVASPLPQPTGGL